MPDNSRIHFNFSGIKKKNSGSFRINVLFNSPNTQILSPDGHGRQYLRIKNVGTSMVWLGFNQTDATNQGYPLDPNEYIEFAYPDNCPDELVTATAETGDTVLSIVMVRWSQ